MGAPCPADAPSWVVLDLDVPLRRQKGNQRGGWGQGCARRVGTERGGGQDTYL